MTNVKFLISNKIPNVKCPITKIEHWSFRINNFIRNWKLGIRNYIYFYILFLVFTISHAQMLPPLPIDSLKKIELKYSDTIIKPIPIDTFFLNIFGGNIFGGKLNLQQGLNKKSWLEISLDGGKDFDYSDYLYGNGKINLGWLKKNFWHELELGALYQMRKTKHFEQLLLSYNPIWFISGGSLTFNNHLRGARYIDTRSNFLLAGKLDWNFNFPSSFGIINGDANIFAQIIKKNNYQHWITSAIELTDLITFSDNLYIQPGATYYINKKQIETKVNIGILIMDIKTVLNLSRNSIKPFYFDTLYKNVYPLLVFDSIDYPFCSWQADVQVIWKDLQASINYERYSSYINYSSQDSWILPQYIESHHTALNFGAEYSWQFIKNNIYLKYTPDKINLIPKYTISDSMLINLGRFDFNLVGFFSDKRIFDNQTLKSYLTLSSEIGFNWKSIRPYVGVDNILDNRYEILPSRFSLGRKYFLGIEYLNNK